MCNPSIVEKYEYVELQAKKVIMNCRSPVLPFLTKLPQNCASPFNFCVAEEDTVVLIPEISSLLSCSLSPF